MAAAKHQQLVPAHNTAAVAQQAAGLQGAVRELPGETVQVEHCCFSPHRLVQAGVTPMQHQLLATRCAGKGVVLPAG